MCTPKPWETTNGLKESERLRELTLTAAWRMGRNGVRMGTRIFLGGYM